MIMVVSFSFDEILYCELTVIMLCRTFLNEVLDLVEGCVDVVGVEDNVVFDEW